jgi:DNA-binding transcriptional ArsR family regulator
MATDVTSVTDSKVLAAMSHPARRRLLDVIHVQGPSTVTTLSKATGLAIGSVSHHLRTLAGAGLIEEAPDLARDRRERWWQPRASGLRWSTRDFQGDASSAAIAEAALSLNLEHHTSKVRAWRARADEASAEWQDAAFSTDTWLRLSPAELAALSVELNALLERWHSRAIPDDGIAREHVFVFAHGIPGAP